VFSNFRDPLELLKARLDKKDIPYIHLRSEDTEDVRLDKWLNQWPKQEHQVFLCTLGVGSESINLTSAQRAIFLDLSWSPAQNDQATGRLYRPGQHQVVQFIHIRAENTVDYRVLGANVEKRGWFRTIFGPFGEDEEDTANER